MAESLDELCDRILKAKANDAYDDADIDRLVTRSLGLASAVERLSGDLEESRGLVEASSRRITELESLHHLTQYAEETS